jgi:amidase
MGTRSHGHRWPACADYPRWYSPRESRSDRLPVGLQVIGPYLKDRTVIDVAGRIAELTGGFVPAPGY